MWDENKRCFSHKQLFTFPLTIITLKKKHFFLETICKMWVMMYEKLDSTCLKHNMCNSKHCGSFKSMSNDEKH